MEGWFIWVDHRRVVFAPSSLCVWSQGSWRSQRIILLPLGLLHVHSRIQRIVNIFDVVGSSEVSSQFASVILSFVSIQYKKKKTGL